VYPAVLKARRIAGHALVHMVVDTLGNVEERSIEILETPDSAFIAPLREALLAFQFEPAQLRGRPVKARCRTNSTSRRRGPRPAPARHHGTRAAAAASCRFRHRTIEDALDSTNGASPAIRVYARVRPGDGMARQGPGQPRDDNISARRWPVIGTGGAAVDLAPVLRSLADSVGRFNAQVRMS